MTAHRHAGQDALKFRFQCLSRGLFHIDTVAIVSAPSASPYTSPAIASPRVRANFIRHTRRFFSDSVGSAPRERPHEPGRKEGRRGRAEKEEGGRREGGQGTTEKGGHRSHLQRSRRMLQRPERLVQAVRRLRPSPSVPVRPRSSPFVRSLSASYYSTAEATRSQRASSFTYRDSPRRGRRGGRRRNAGHPREKRTNDDPRAAGHWQREKKKKLDAGKEG